MGNHQVDVQSVNATFRGLMLPMGLLVEELNVQAQGLHLETDPFAASLESPGTFDVFVADDSLTEFVAKRVPGNLRNVSIATKDGQLLVKASVVMIIELPANAVCTLRIVDKRFLFVDLLSVNVMGTGATNLVQSQLEKINPILDADDFPVRASLETVEIVDGGVKLTGTVAPP